MESTLDYRSARGCYHPIQLQESGKDIGEGRTIYVRCGSRRENKCAACAEQYRRDAITLIEKGVPKRRRKGYHLLFVTLTAPGAAYFGSANHRRPGKKTGNCKCGKVHQHDDPLIGAPINFNKFDYERAVSWNDSLPELWRRFLIALEREMPTQRIEYVKVAEVQRRGLFHLHVILRVEITKEHKIALERPEVTQAIRKAAAIPDVDGHKFGKQLDIAFATQRPPQRRKGESEKDYKKRVNRTQTRNTFARYLAKYATKGTDHATRKGLVGKYVLAHHAKLRTASKPKAERLRDERLKTYATRTDINPFVDTPQEKAIRSRAEATVNDFGFAGQFLTKSRNYSTTFKAIRAEQRKHAISISTEDTTKWSIVGFGVDIQHQDEALAFWEQNLKPRGYSPPVFD
jgi:hypothetical protein